MSTLSVSIFVTLIFLIIFLKLYTTVTKKKCKCKKRLDGKVVLITGGNSGIGLETARELARRGARVVIASRDQRKSSAAVDDIIASTGNKHVEHMYLDLASFSNVREFAEQFNKSYDRLDILVNNAGCAVIQPKLTADGINIILQINYFGPFLLTNLLLKKLIQSKPSRIIIVSSIGHVNARYDINDIKGHRKRHYLIYYNNSKLCNILWAKALAKKLPEGITVNAVNPGIVKTPIFKVYDIFRPIVLGFIGLVFKNSIEGAQTTIHVALAKEFEEKSGGYYSECAEGWLSAKASDEQLIYDTWNKTLSVINSDVRRS